MNIANISTIHAGTTPIILGRILNSSGDYAVQADIESITYSIYELRNSVIAYQDYSNISVSIASVIFDTLQKDGLWKEDDYGYNFKHILIGSGAEFPLKKRNRLLLVEYTCTFTDGFVVVFGKRFRTV